MTLTKDTPRDYELGDLNTLPMAASTKIYEGAAVGDSGTGYVRPLVATDKFRGFALQTIDNSTGAAGDKKIQVRHEGYAKLDVVGADITKVGSDVYASDDNTFTLTTTGNTKMGRIKRWVSGTTCIVEFDATVIF